ncbi:RagB/SusD family nutrient uptake outer membrane protein [Pedobacter puniceum]|uniref:RagB/SusD family nutrient uptake outer membrane protein n=1 Tax=Pedobacter puniceum TaxID=2666136 RepID=A0A7K0FIE7_9SPHI|nr:RagB/SusD family nutrient uptake outer membrane protein [Pedobacter puniceum]MRX45759.1 RagB/SusD family nutrient uptake outer membrane protein [Pedobacter puniceum]
MKQLKTLIFTILVLVTSSCEKFLDTKPTDFISPEAYYNTPQQLEIALNGVYDQLGANDFYGSLYIDYLNWSTDESCDKNALPSIRTYNYAASEPNIFNLWRGLYSAINRANNLLANIDKVEMNEARKKAIKGEALFLRAYYYFILVSNWGDVPLILEPIKEISPDVSTDVARAETRVVYEQILKDMKEAEVLLDRQTATSLGAGGRVSKTAVQGIIGRVCLYMASYPLRDLSKYTEAITYLNKVINSQEHALNPDYKQIFINYAQDKYDVKESIWEVEFMRTSSNIGGDGGRVGNNGGILCNDPQIGTSYSLANASGKLFKLYQQDPNSVVTPFKASFDIRRDWNCANYNYTTATPGVFTRITDPYAMSMGKYRREYELVFPKNRNSTPINFPILRYADILLMLAEAENEVNNGPTAAAYDAINQVRRRGYGILEGNVLKSITVTAGGSGYSAANPPRVLITGGGGSGAEGTAIISNGRIIGVDITSRGSLRPGTYFTSAPTVTFIGGAGSGATATATITQSTDADLTPGLGYQQFFQAIQDERARELCFESLRRSDLIRWKLLIPVMKDLIIDITSSSTTTALKSSLSTAARNVDTRHYLFPIPIKEISLNKLLTQNPEW